MINFEHIMQVKAFARQDGAMLSLLWISSFVSLLCLPTLPLSNILALATPFFIGWRLTKFRNYALDGVISLRRGYAYAIYTFFYASLIFALVQYLYFRFIDNGQFISMLTEAANAIATIYKENAMPLDGLHESIAQMAELRPIQWAFMFLLQNMMTGVVVSLPIAAVCARRAGKPTSTNQRHKN